MTSTERELRDFVTHSHEMAERCTRDAEDMDRCGLPDVARQLRHQHDLWLHLAAELDQHLLGQADQTGALDDLLPIDFEGANA